MNLKGIHHVSAITASAEKNLAFYTNVMGMRLVKKTVNQDATSMYHLFYGDEKGNPGTELTFFEIPMAAPNHHGNNSISATSLRVASDAALHYWEKRLESFHVEHAGIQERAGRLVLPFQDFERQRLVLVSDERNAGVPGGVPWNKSDVPPAYGIIGLGPIELTVPELEPTARMLTGRMGFREVRRYDKPELVVYETGAGGTGGEVHVVVRPELPRERPGRGGVHHVAFRVEDEAELREWVAHLKENRIASSGFVDRFYFKSLYFKEPNGILFELATDGPGFDTDEPLDQLGETLALPPFLESKRADIEASLKPLTNSSFNSKRNY